MIEFHAVHKHYGSTHAVNDITCTIPRGAMVGLIGPNGSGKTTLLRMLVTLVTPSSGTITVNGQSTTQAAAAVRQLIGYMPDSFGVYEAMTAQEYLDFYARCDHIAAPIRSALIPSILTRIGLREHGQTPVMSLSRGMAQRLSLGRALLRDPEVLVLDEPASGLDPRARIELRTLLHSLHEQGKTILISSHILSDLADLCTHMLILENGRMVAYDTLDALTHATERQTIQVVIASASSELPRCATAQGYVATARDSDGLRYDLTGPAAPAARAALLTALVSAGVPVVSFSAPDAALEHAFLRLTAATEEATND